MNVFAGLLAATFVAALGVAIWPLGSGGTSWEAFGISLLPAGGLAFFVGLPTFLVANRFGWANALTSGIAGFAVGCLGFQLIPDIAAWDGPAPLTVTDLFVRYVVFGSIGLPSGLSFWVAWRFVPARARPIPLPPQE